jgi:transcriptional regulator with XRE-family HTH domain
MKNMNNKKLSPIKRAKEFPGYEKIAKAARFRIRLSAEIYSARKKKNMSQMELSKKAETSQKVLSHIENADVNVGGELMNRLAGELSFTSETFARIFDCPAVFDASSLGSSDSQLKLPQESISQLIQVSVNNKETY